MMPGLSRPTCVLLCTLQAVVYLGNPRCPAALDDVRKLLIEPVYEISVLISHGQVCMRRLARALAARIHKV